eukprot:CAMPEP_0118709990 /NCGR_PEP_ID=MMETSP0800-20121206/23045_1 /TAXON_ID=210618 ORGANISM="Striatella unipunctata, Strain CCMP2910" /NCGR_SAMPLE_ID=MMETSP0800 /ASSEMBLY_ACC=CAM_ASM_000638 /LENGTH=50 /DNA_ID=CAMNT_0006613947 /DNA_START=87 /DNA_END=236 /DNA_ORIENTATION=-
MNWEDFEEDSIARPVDLCDGEKNSLAQKMEVGASLADTHMEVVYCDDDGV